MKTIAITGKGGTGKSTISALVTRWLSENKSKAILAVDADSNVNLNDLLGVELRETIGYIREEMKSTANNLPAGMTKQQFLDYKIQSSLIETSKFDLIAMGRPEGAGCYCYANNLLREILLTLSKNYEFVVIDNEAGMEHLSRRTTHNIDYLLVISDPSARGIQTALKINRLIKELDTRVKERYIIINRVRQSISEVNSRHLQNGDLKLLDFIPEDQELLEKDEKGLPIWDLSKDSPIVFAIDKIMYKLML
jgi:CO dehydrogenase maturation factor